MTNSQLLDGDRVLLGYLDALGCAADLEKIADHAIFFLMVILADLITLLHFACALLSMALQWIFVVTLNTLQAQVEGQIAEATVD